MHFCVCGRTSFELGLSFFISRNWQCLFISPLRNWLILFIVVLRLSMTSGMFFSLSSSLSSLCISRSALLNAGHPISRSHACAGSFKTAASHREIHDVIRSWIQMNPVKMENIGSGSPARILLAKEPL